MRATIVAGLCLAAVVGADDDRERRRHVLVTETIWYCQERFDAKKYLVRDAGGRAGVDTGSLEYATALLEMDRDVRRANRILRAVLFAQDGKPGSSTYGGLRSYPDEKRVSDPNAVLRLAPWLAYVTREHGGGRKQEEGKLEASTHELLWDALPLALHAARERAVDAQSTSAYLSRIASMTLLGQLTRRPRDVRRAAEALDEWLKVAGERGIGEYNSPSALAEGIVAMQWVWEGARLESTRQRAELALHVLYRDLLEHYHAPSGMVVAAADRATRGEYTSGTGPSQALLWYHLGEPERAGPLPWALALAVQEYSPSASLLALARPESYPRVVRRRMVRRVGRGVETTAYLTPHFALATQSGEGGRGQIPVMFAYAAADPRPSGYLHSLPNPTPLHSVQDRNAAICCFVFGERELAGEGFRGVWGALGPAAAATEVLVGGKPWTRESVALAPHTPICARVFDAYVALVPLAVDPLKIRQDPLSASRPVALRIEDGEVTFGLAVRAARGRAPVVTEPHRAGLAILIESPDRFASLTEFSDFVEMAELEESREGNVHTVRWRIGDHDLLLRHDLATLKVLGTAGGG